MSFQIIRDLESLALLVSSLCHDVDHRGTTNSFQLASNSVLAALYSSEGSVMEVSSAFLRTTFLMELLKTYLLYPL